MKKPVKSDILSAYKSGTPELQKAFERLYGKETFITSKPVDKDILSSIKNFADILRLSKTTQAAFDKLHKGKTTYGYALEQLVLISKVLNLGWTPNWSDSNEAKYYPYFQWQGAGFGFALTYYDYDDTYTLCGSRLCFKERKTAEFAGRVFIDIYNAYLK